LLRQGAARLRALGALAPMGALAPLGAFAPPGGNDQGCGLGHGSVYLPLVFVERALIIPPPVAYKLGIG